MGGAQLDGGKKSKPGKQRSKLMERSLLRGCESEDMATEGPGRESVPLEYLVYKMQRASVAIGSEACSWSGTLRSVLGWASRAQNAGSGNRGMTPHATPNTPKTLVMRAKHKGR